MAAPLDANRRQFLALDEQITEIGNIIAGSDGMSRDLEQRIMGIVRDVVVLQDRGVVDDRDLYRRANTLLGRVEENQRQRQLALEYQLRMLVNFQEISNSLSNFQQLRESPQAVQAFADRVVGVIQEVAAHEGESEERQVFVDRIQIVVANAAPNLEDEQAEEMMDVDLPQEANANSGERIRRET